MITDEFKRLEELRQKQDMMQDRLGDDDVYLRSRQQVNMIGNVFYNMLTYIYREQKDKRIGEFAD